MADNCVIAFIGPRKLEVQNVEFPKLIGPGGRKCDHDAILKLVATNICGSDQHIYHGRFAAPTGMLMGHEMTGMDNEISGD